MRSLSIVLALSLLSCRLADERPSRVEPNDLRTAAGIIDDGVLTVRLSARMADWHPDGPDLPGIRLIAFGEDGGPAQIPGPLIRVPAGTDVRVFVRNTLQDEPLIIALPGGARDSVRVPPGEVRELGFTASQPGTYFYRGSTETEGDPFRMSDSQLYGAVIVDPPGVVAARDRVFMLGAWNPNPGLLTDTSLVRFAINGLAWPHTERLDYDEGDTIRWRVINASAAVHPMHLHGFHFRVTSRGDAVADSVYAPTASTQYAVTERLAPFTTMSLEWVPDRAGNWLFHCHDNLHILPSRPLAGIAPPADAGHDADHASGSMGGLVLGVHVRPRGAHVDEGPDVRRRLRLVAHAEEGAAAEPAYAFALEETGRPPAGPSLPGPPIVLRRGEPVAITVVNGLAEPTSVHWHGIELESFYDGVAGFSGRDTRLAPIIAPRDSFEVRFTPPRAGTFIYHTHVDEVRQQRAGLSGAIVVLEDGVRYDPETDHVVLVSTPRAQADQGRVLINGALNPAPLVLRAGARHRLRIINIHTYRPSMRLSLRQDTALVQWRALAKDGADLPPDRATLRPALLGFGNGETYDFELVPEEPGDLRIQIHSAVGELLGEAAVHVR